MPNPLTFSLSDYPNLAKLINGQDVVLKMKVRAGTKTLTGQGEYITLQPESIDMEESERRMNPTEVLLASINDNLARQPIATP